MNYLAPHPGWSRRTRVGITTAALTLLVVLGRVLVMAPSAEAHADATFTVLYSFKWDFADGAFPYAGVVLDAAGNLYGTTYWGGASGLGTVFKLDTTGAETVLHSFNGGDGSNPADLIRDANGNLYGTTQFGGASDAGTVFKLDTTGAETVLHSFVGPPTDGLRPIAGLVRDAGGSLYGTTLAGGSSSNCGGGCGTVFRLDTTGTESVLHNFVGSPTDGAFPYAGLVRDAAGNLYGTTKSGGSSSNCSDGCGTVFKLDPTGKETVLHSFNGEPSDGSTPTGDLVLDAAGNLYGTTWFGGSSKRCTLGCGTVFRLDTTGAETMVHSFAKKRRDGKFPYAGLVRDAAGNLYGTTVQGGASNNCVGGCGTVFRLDTTGGETLLHRFVGGSPPTDGERPTAGLVRDAAGNLYGTSPNGGAVGVGTVFKISH